MSQRIYAHVSRPPLMRMVEEATSAAEARQFEDDWQNYDNLDLRLSMEHAIVQLLRRYRADPAMVLSVSVRLCWTVEDCPLTSAELSNAMDIVYHVDIYPFVWLLKMANRPE